MRNSFLNPTFDKALESSINQELDKLTGDDRQKALKQLEEIAGTLTESTFDEGYDNSTPENIVGELKAIGAWDKLESFWKQTLTHFKDVESLKGSTPELTADKITHFKRLTSSYPTIQVEKFLNAYGILNRKINRATHKRFLPDGSWISNGVRFGP